MQELVSSKLSLLDLDLTSLLMHLYKNNSTLFKRICTYFMQYLFISIASKGSCSSCDDMQEDTKCPDITTLIIIFVKYLRRDVIGSAYDFVAS